MHEQMIELKSCMNAGALQQCDRQLAATPLETKLREGAGSRLNAAAALVANRTDGTDPEKLHDTLARAIAMYIAAWCGSPKALRWQMISALSRESAQELHTALTAPKLTPIAADLAELQLAVQARILADQRNPTPTTRF